jgi:pre-mRNA-processing factor 6
MTFEAAPSLTCHQAQQESVMKHCLAAEPRHGELWTSISKRPENWRMGTRDVLLVALQSIPAW